jgi:regulation of enolase protein 1 (concanavalin A-like superfamily)
MKSASKENKLKLMNTAQALSETPDSIEMTAPEQSDFFIDEMNGIEKNDAPFFYEKRKGDFVLSAKVQPQFTKYFDAGGLFIYDSPKKWIKLEFERTDLGYPSIVSVITNGMSDDCNGERMDNVEAVYLQIIRKSDYWMLHYSLNGKNWKFVRYFKLKMKSEVKIGLEAQAPIGKSCKVLFSKIKISENDVVDMKKGK